MGGVMAASDTYSATINNPAMVATENYNQDASLIVPSTGELVGDPFGMERRLDKLQQVASDLNDVPSLENANRMAATLETLRDVSYYNYGYQHAVFVVPSTTLGGGAFISRYELIGQRVEVNDYDFSAPDNPLIDAYMRYNGLVITEFGLTYAKKLRFDREGKYVEMSDEQFVEQRSYNEFTVGFSPKLMLLRAYDYREALTSAAMAPDFSQGVAGSSFNLDAGITRSMGYIWNFGLLVKNLVPLDFDTGESQFKLRPWVRVGARYRTLETTVAMDLDITRAMDLAYQNRSQRFALGGEYRLYKWLALRGGYNVDLETFTSSRVSAGLGLAIWVFHLDAAYVSGSQEQGTYLQLRTDF